MYIVTSRPVHPETTGSEEEREWCMPGKHLNVINQGTDPATANDQLRQIHRMLCHLAYQSRGSFADCLIRELQACEDLGEYFRFHHGLGQVHRVLCDLSQGRAYLQSCLAGMGSFQQGVCEIMSSSQD